MQHGSISMNECFSVREVCMRSYGGIAFEPFPIITLIKPNCAGFYETDPSTQTQTHNIIRARQKTYIKSRINSVISGPTGYHHFFF